MRVALAIGILLSGCVLFAQQRQVFRECDKKASTQADLNDCAYADEKSADEELNRTYQALLRKAAGDPVAVEKTRVAQRAWVAFRDAHIAALYPHDAPDKRLEYGTVYPMCVSLLKSELTRQRTKMLKEMLSPVEGDVCSSGSYYPQPERSKGHQQKD